MQRKPLWLQRALPLRKALRESRRMEEESRRFYDRALTGRGSPWLRGVACGFMTTLGGLGHTLPFLIADFRMAVAVVPGGLLVFAAGVLIGGA